MCALSAGLSLSFAPFRPHRLLLVLLESHEFILGEWNQAFYQILDDFTTSVLAIRCSFIYSIHWLPLGFQSHLLLYSLYAKHFQQ